MKLLQVNLPDEVVQRIEKIAIEQGKTAYTSVNTNEVRGFDALVTDLLILGLDELEVGESQFPDEEV